MDRYTAAIYLMLAVGIALIVIGQVGERLGWWGDLGLWLTGAGLLATMLAAGVAIQVGASRRQVRALAGDVRRVGSDVREVGSEVRQVGSEVRQVGADLGGKLEAQAALLAQIRDRL